MDLCLERYWQGQRQVERWPCDDLPAPTIMALGLSGQRIGQHWLEDGNGGGIIAQSDKPPYCVPSMIEIAAMPFNGRTVVSFFAGGGGSSTGYRMAGYRIAWANEFIPRMQETYRANHPDTILDGRSIRDIQPRDVLAALNLAPGDLDLLDGSPPCQSFSMAGQRERGWTKVRDYGHGIKQRNDDLFAEYIRFVKELQPKVFIAENVSGLVKGTAKGTFKEILKALKACGYAVEAKLLDAQWLGVPQMRQRIIFCGVRVDLRLSPVFPKPLSYRYSVRDAISACVMNDTSGLFSQGNVTDRPCPTIMIGPNALNSRHYQVEALEGANGFNGHASSSVDGPAATVQAGRPLAAELRLPPGRLAAVSGESVPMFRKPDEQRPSPTIMTVDNDIGHPVERRKLTIAELKRICSFPDDYILTGSYAEQWAVCGNAVPPVMMFHMAAAVRDGIFAKLKEFDQ